MSGFPLSIPCFPKCSDLIREIITVSLLELVLADFNRIVGSGECFDVVEYNLTSCWPSRRQFHIYDEMLLAEHWE